MEKEGEFDGHHSCPVPGSGSPASDLVASVDIIMDRIIYMADDDRKFREMTSTLLEREDFKVRSFETGDALMKECRQALPDLVLLDIVMPGTDGLSCCSFLRKEHMDLPIIIISAKDSPYDRISALGLGCDDYLVKPCHPLELILRIRALLRRCGKVQERERNNDLEFGPLKLLPNQMMSLNGGDPVSLPRSEYNFLAYLIHRPGQSASRAELLRDLWHVEADSGKRAADYLVKRLRKKLDENDSPVTVETMWGYGFRLKLKESK